MPILVYIILGLRVLKQERGLPVCLDCLPILALLCEQWIQPTPSNDILMLWAAACTRFLWFSSGRLIHSSFTREIWQGGPSQSIKSFSWLLLLPLTLQNHNQAEQDRPIRSGCHYLLRYDKGSCLPSPCLMQISSRPGLGTRPSLQVSLWYSANSFLTGLPCTESIEFRWSERILIQQP